MSAYLTNLPVELCAKPDKVNGNVNIGCRFCINNKEPASVYMSHSLKNSHGDRVVCPILSAHVCPLCGKFKLNIKHGKNNFLNYFFGYFNKAKLVILPTRLSTAR